MTEPRDRIFTRTEYRRVIAWPERILREAPFFDRVLGTATDPAGARRDPDRKAAVAPRRPRCILDVGCGTGEHTRHFAERGWTAVGIDVSENMIEDTAELAGPAESGGTARFELRDAADAARLPEAPFDAAICLGNMIAFLESREELDGVIGGIGAALAPGAPFLVQLLNYERIETLPVRALPVNVRPLPEEEGDGEIVFIRVLSPKGDGTVDFFPITLTLTPGAEPLVEVRSAKQGKHFAWKRDDLRRALSAAGFGDARFFGAMAETAFDPRQSPDLVVVARRR